jgi:phosphatidylglycerol:prolipoprotein diacylglycerol transferase
MSFHGGLIGIIVGGVIFSWRTGIPGLVLADLVAATAPIGLGFGRIGNFINGELYGRATDVPWAMVFPAGGDIPRHPSQLYESFFEGPVLLAALWLMRDRVKRKGAIAGLFLILYGGIRFVIEFFREPDLQLGFVAGLFTMGQVLSGTMIVGGSVFLMVLRIRGK